MTGRRVLVFSQFTQMLAIIRRQLVKQGAPYFYIDGQTPPVERVSLCERFNNGEGDLFLVSLKAGVLVSTLLEQIRLSCTIYGGTQLLNSRLLTAPTVWDKQMRFKSFD